MTNFDPLADKVYAVRLANLGEERDVIANEDILNDQGALLVKKGTRINQNISDRIVKFKLLKPIENSIDIASSIGPHDLYRILLTQLKKLPEAYQIHENAQIGKLFKQLTMELPKYPIIRQKLTVMQEQMPSLFTQTICVTWLSVAISQEIELSQERMENCFLAALAHDFGMMHIDPAILKSQDKLSPAEWRQIQAHTVIGQKLMESMPNLNKSVSRIVVEHHERCDGTGYPVGKFCDSLTQESQIIALSDSVLTVYSKRIHGQSRTIRDLLPFIQVNSESHFYKTYTALIRVLKKTQLTNNAFINNDNIDSEVTKLIENNNRLSYLLTSLELIVQEISFDTSNRTLQSSRAILIQIMKTVRGSGILDEGYIRWLKQVKQEKLTQAYRETADAILMLEEIEWHLHRIIRMLDSFIEQGPESESALKNIIKTNLPIQEHTTEVEEYAIT